MESDIPSAASVNDPMISGPYIALQQQHNNSGISRVPGYQAEKQQQQTITRTPAVPVMAAEIGSKFRHLGFLFSCVHATV